ncbi:hypothetical protein BDN70DRAFT_934391 [Pholiota conissans]|uniref:Transmembrane protein n=1 Tax=Pholiota conissans TaxID=109636 RepID=A0A9P6CRM8_9AGAR|nr:hypothetical protein BDN70DRAFT_934391 [Pholiota conissans]
MGDNTSSFRMPQPQYTSEITEETKHPIPPNTAQIPTLASNPPPKYPDIEHHRKVLRYWIICTFSFLVISPLLSVLLGVNLRTRDFAYTPDPANPTFTGRSLELEAVLVSADPMNFVMTFDWTILGENVNSPCTTTALDKCTDINIFFDNNLLAQTDSSTRTSDPPDTPLFKHNAKSAILMDITANTPTFRTNLQLFSPGNRESSLIFYPFDVYTAEIFIFAQEAGTNNTVGIQINSTRGIAVGFKISAVDFPGVPIPAGDIDIFVTLQRGTLIRAFCIICTIAVWLITLVLLLLMFTSVVFGFRQKSEILIVPVATVFAFTQLRGSMPGAPAGFGDILDFVGLLPCLAFLSISASLTLGAFILTDPTKKPYALDWDMLFEAFPILNTKRGRVIHDKRVGDDSGQKDA